MVYVLHTTARYLHPMCEVPNVCKNRCIFVAHSFLGSVARDAPMQATYPELPPREFEETAASGGRPRETALQPTPTPRRKQRRHHSRSRAAGVRSIASLVYCHLGELARAVGRAGRSRLAAGDQSRGHPLRLVRLVYVGLRFRHRYLW